MTRPGRRRLAVLGVVWLGGALGTGARYAVAVALPPVGDVPGATLAVNLAGAFLLGLLLGRLAAADTGSARRRFVQLGLGTGFLGGFTTYSSLTVETVALLRSGHGLTALGYALGSVLLGAAAAAAGMALGRLADRGRP